MNEPDDLEAYRESQQDPDYDPILWEIEAKHWEDTYKSRRLADITEGRLTQPPWLFEDFLLSKSITLVSGEPFAGKTMLLAAMMLALDSGEPLFGTFMPMARRRVMFIGQDAPTWDYRGQMFKIGKGLGEPGTNGSICILNEGLNLLSPDFIPMIDEGVRLFGLNVLMIDTLLELHGLEENSNSEMRRVMGVLKFLRDKHRLSIILTTHTSKGDGRSSNYRARGASTIVGSVDQHLILRPHYGEGKADGFYFKAPKSRGSAAPDSQIVRFESEPGSPGIKLVYAGELYSERQEFVLSLVREGTGARKDILAGLARANSSWSQIELQRRTTNTLSYLVKKGKLVKTERGVYAISPGEAKP